MRDSLELGFASDLTAPVVRFQPNTLELGAAWGVVGAVAGVTPFGTAYLVQNAGQLGQAARLTAELALLTIVAGAGVGVAVALSRSIERRWPDNLGAAARVARRTAVASSLLLAIGALTGAIAAHRFGALPEEPSFGLVPASIAYVLALLVLTSCFCIRTALEAGIPRAHASGLRAAALPGPVVLLLLAGLAYKSEPWLSAGAANSSLSGALIGLLVAATTSVWLSVSLELAARRAPAVAGRPDTASA